MPRTSLAEIAGNFLSDLIDLVYLILARMVGLTISDESWDEILLLLVRW